MELTPEEEVVNKLLMELKRRELDNAYKTLQYPPSQNFFQAKEQIDKSDIYNIIKVMPKGIKIYKSLV